MKGTIFDYTLHMIANMQPSFRADAERDRVILDILTSHCSRLHHNCGVVYESRPHSWPSRLDSILELCVEYETRCPCDRVPAARLRRWLRTAIGFSDLSDAASGNRAKRYRELDGRGERRGVVEERAAAGVRQWAVNRRLR